MLTWDVSVRFLAHWYEISVAIYSVYIRNFDARTALPVLAQIPVSSGQSLWLWTLPLCLWTLPLVFGHFLLFLLKGCREVRTLTKLCLQLAQMFLATAILFARSLIGFLRSLKPWSFRRCRRLLRV